MSDELKPCPWCGNEPTLREYEGGWIIECEHHKWNENGEALRNETIAGDVDLCSWGSTESARDALIAAWNARAAVTDEQFAMAIHDGRAWRAVRECRITDVHDFRDGSRTFFLSCGHQRHGERGTRFRYCDICGAKVAAPSELTCHMNHVLLYDEEGVEGIECDECGWEDIHGWDEPMPERCPGCNRKVVG